MSAAECSKEGDAAAMSNDPVPVASGKEQRRSARVSAKRARGDGTSATSPSRVMMSDGATTTLTTTCTIDHLPDEILMIVLLRFFESRFILTTVASVCMRWRAISKRGVPCSLKLHAYASTVRV